VIFVNDGGNVEGGFAHSRFCNSADDAVLTAVRLKCRKRAKSLTP
jgi:hypothetical protein